MFLSATRTGLAASEIPSRTRLTTRFFSFCHVHHISKEARKIYKANYNQEELLKIYVDPELYKKKKERAAERKRLRYHEDDEYRRMRLAYGQKYLAGRSQSELEKALVRDLINHWCTRYAWVREELDWKAHIPVVSQQKITRYCASCSITKTGGFKVWWSRKYDPTLWDCTTCFLNGDPRQAMPRGYEDVTTIAELRARKQKFDALALGTEPKSDELASGQRKNDP